MTQSYHLFVMTEEYGTKECGCPRELYSSAMPEVAKVTGKQLRKIGASAVRTFE